MRPHLSLLALTLLLPMAAQAADCPALLKTQGELPKLRSKDSLDLCGLYAGKPMVIVNTASHCGFTPQFKGLEAVYQKYKGQGLEVLGVPSDDFKQEDADAAETAKVCYGNYGVTFNMTSVQHVSGDEAIPLFKDLAQQADQVPRWNFFKYVVDRQGKVVAQFSSLTKPDDPQLQAAIEKAIASQP